MSRLRIQQAAASAVLSATLALTAGPATAQGAASTDRLADLIRERIETAARGGSAMMVLGDERIHAASELPTFYRGRDHQPAWVNDLGPRAVADSLLWAVEGAVLEGLESNHYHLVRIRDIYADVRHAERSATEVDQARLAELDLLMTDAFLVLAAHLSAGRVDPTTIHPEWTASRSAVDVVAELDMALATGRVAGTLHKLLPVHPGYERLRAALADHRRVAGQGGWPILPGRTLGPGTKDPAVALLRARLRMSKDLAPTVHAKDDQLYDDEVEAAVRRFQARHAIEPDGVVRLETSAMLNIPVEDRIRQIELNLERWRWLPQDLGDRHIRVNIAGFDMHVMEGDSAVFRSRVLVGQRYRRTPVFSDRMTYLVLNPTWTIPPGILEEDKLPLIRRDPTYLRRNNITVLGSDGRAVDPSSVDFNRVTGRTAYRFRMDPGPENPLGRVKFMFPNAHHVYLHDTPDHDDFDRPWGAVSSGCIRVEDSMALTEYLLAGEQGWDRARIDAALQTPGERTVRLPEALPIHILYWTAWVEPDGSVHFRSDIYDRDDPLDMALSAPPPSAIAGPTP